MACITDFLARKTYWFIYIVQMPVPCGIRIHGQ